MTDLASRQFTEWLAVASLARSHIAHPHTWPNEVAFWKGIERNALIEAGKLLAVKSAERGRDAMMQAAE